MELNNHLEFVDPLTPKKGTPVIIWQESCVDPKASLITPGLEPVAQLV